MTGLKGWQWQDKRNSNGIGKRSDNGRIRGVAVAEKVDSQRENTRRDNKRSGSDRERGVSKAEKV
jgi:hypothetical protein